ncbi:MAG: Asp-tRNA(Asn)/Glu-tRNA(Gln) amidotransferase subunit GatB [Candidatus Nanohaloarchaea archaeon]
MSEVKIGLETHVQLDTETKLFCGCPNEEADEPNENVCEICLGHPGSKPRLNRNVLERAVKTALSLGCDINEDIFFSRKTYFYPDMSKNYQITQYELPVGEDGSIEVRIGDDRKEVGIKRLHIEEDPARLKHSGGSVADSDYTKVDYNRAGTPLLEIVTEPDFSSPGDAREYLQQLVRTLEYLDVYSPESEFSIKSDANISLEGGERVEVKNITGMKGIQQALSYEISRQKQLRKRGREVEQETRSYNAAQEITEKLRQKETEEDYGYIFDPDLTRQELDQDFRSGIREGIPELPKEKLERFMGEYDLPEKVAESLVVDPEIAEDFESLAGDHDTEIVASWMTGELKKTLNYNETDYAESGLKYDWLEYVIGLLEDGRISDRNAEQVLREMVEDPRDPEEIVEERDLLMAEDDEIESFVEEAVQENEEAVQDYRDGKDEALNFLVGQVMQKSRGKAEAKEAREKIKEMI